MSRMSVVVLLCAVTALLGGCAAAVIGGAAAGGYYIGKDARPATQIAADAALTGTIKARLIADPAVKAFDINVDTYESIVILRGRVEKSEQRGIAERIARSASGVKGVRNELKLRGR
jgi:hyperosmotically inducible periplasmic protein